MRSSLRISLLASLSGLALSTPVQAQNAAEDAAAEPTIIVTGTRTSTRTVQDSPVPVDVLSGAAITESGQVETNKILNKLVPSFNFPQPAIADGSDALRPATLRGLGPDQTLVLVNGKRRHVSALLNGKGTVGRGRYERHSGPRDRPDRSAARWRVVAIRVGRDRGRDQRPP